MNVLLMDLLKALLVVTAVLWIPCGVIGIGWIIKWMIRERRWWQRANREAFPEECGEEVTYVD